MKAKVYPYKPDYAVSPGEILKEHLAVKGLTQSAFAGLCGLPPQTVNRIIEGKEKVTSEMAVQFEKILGLSAVVWNNLEASYRLHKAETEESKQLLSDAGKAKNLPIKKLG